VPTKAGSGYLKAVWLKVVGPVFLRLARRSTPGPPPRSPGLARDINLHQKSAPETGAEFASVKGPDTELARSLPRSKAPGVDLSPCLGPCPVFAPSVPRPCTVLPRFCPLPPGTR